MLVEASWKIGLSSWYVNSFEHQIVHQILFGLYFILFTSHIRNKINLEA